jgi:hypothetical protein
VLPSRSNLDASTSMTLKPQKSSSQAPSSQKPDESRTSNDSTGSRPPLGLLLSQPNSSASTDPGLDSAPSANTPRSTTQPSSPALWGNWRRDTDSKSDWGKTAAPSTYQRREQGIKVLRPSGASKTSAPSTTTSSSGMRVFSSSSSTGGSTPQTGPLHGSTQSSSRFFDDGKRKVNGDDSANRSASGKEGKITASNPVGQGSAFSWMNG